MKALIKQADDESAALAAELLDKCETGQFSDRFITMVSGPGKKFSASFLATGVISANFSIHAKSAI